MLYPEGTKLLRTTNFYLVIKLGGEYQTKFVYFIFAKEEEGIF